MQLVETLKSRSVASEDSLNMDESLTIDNSLDIITSFKSTRSRTPIIDLETGTLAVLNMIVDRLIHIVSRDAIDGSDVWQSVAFTLLDSLVRLSRLEKQHRCLAALIKQGALNTFVTGMKDIDASLEMIYLPDPSV
jgi:nuclear pore complex protein Nup205